MIDELGLPVGAEALRLRAKAEGWEKGGAVQPKFAKPKLAKAKPKLGKKKAKLGKIEAGKPCKPRQTPTNVSFPTRARLRCFKSRPDLLV
ncbi:hypothetical protein [Polaromonas glacialis]|uniref:hypothetical protein n=1 Tax=Polaromonas glacialis TaxID=866564 RepID=UPI000AAD9267|nr:hypothetical protein [Polaromonas glacialis]